MTEKQRADAFWHLWEARKHLDAARALSWRFDELDDIRLAQIADEARKVKEAAER